MASITGQTVPNSEDLPAEVKVWNVNSEEEILSLKSQIRYGKAIAFSQDGNRIAFSGGSGEIEVWEPVASRRVLSLAGHRGGTNSLAFHPNREELATGGYDETLKIWDLRQGKLLQTLEGHSSFVKCVAYSPNGELLASASWDGTVRLWDSATGKQIRIVKEHVEKDRGNDYVEAVAFSPDGKYLASGGDDAVVTVWEVASGRKAFELKGPGVIDSLAFSPTQQRLASASSWPGSVKVWDLSTRQEVLTLPGESKIVSCVTFSRDGKQLACATSDSQVIIWSAAAPAAADAAQRQQLLQQRCARGTRSKPPLRSNRSAGWQRSFTSIACLN